MVILVYGPNSYSRGRKVREILDDKAKSKDILLGEFDLEEDGAYEKFKDFVGASSMFSPKKIILLQNIFEISASSAKASASQAKKELKQVLSDSVNDKETLVIISSPIKPPASFSFLLEKSEEKFLTGQYFPDLKKGDELRAFIKKEGAARGLKLDVEETATLEGAFGADIWAIVTELDKLALMSKRELPRAASSDYFKTINAFRGGKTVKDRILNLETLLSDRGDEPAKVFNMLGFGFASSELINMLADYDVMIKSGKLDYEEALLDLALRN